MTPDHIITNPCLPPHPDFLDTSTPNDKRRWYFSNPSSPLPIPRPIQPRLDRKHRYSFRLSIQELEVTSHLRNFFIQPKRIVLIVLPILLTIAISVIIVHARHYIKDNMYQSSFSNSTRLIQFCSLYENNYYVNLVTLPIAVVIILIITFNQTRAKHCRFNREKTTGKFSIYAPIPFNPFSKVNRFDTMALCGIVSHEILQIIEEIFLKGTQMKLLTMRGPMFDLIRQIGLVIIIGMRYYPVYAVVEMPKANILYYALCAGYMWIDLTFRIMEQSYCSNIGPLVKTWQKFQKFKNELSTKLATNSLITTTMKMQTDHDDLFVGPSLRGTMNKVRDRVTFRRIRSTTTAVSTMMQVKKSMKISFQLKTFVVLFFSHKRYKLQHQKHLIGR